ncbi:MAG: transglycosylase SLT domain-containing protein [Anaerolineae bacterium]|nr:transglycosylase SLT domain-containing protein [Anaerolineae bacterium]
MQRWRLILAVAFLAVTIVLVSLYPALAQSGSPDEPALSPYWDSDVSRWEPIILQEAHRRSLAPDLIAAVIWKESLGRPTARGPAGAVGLMMLMPFSWRPSVGELHNPWTNLFWGARVLATVICDGDGDLYYALAAYNGSWEKVHQGSTRRYAASVLDYYARAVAVRHGLPADGEWIAIFAIEGTPGPNTITVIGPHRPLLRYTQRPWDQDDIPSAPVGVPPHAIVATFVGDQGVECRVNMWLVAEDGSPLMSPAMQTVFPPSPAGCGGSGQHTCTPTPTATPDAIPTRRAVPTDALTPTHTIAAVVLAGGADLRAGADTWWDPRQTLPAGTNLELIGYDPNFPGWVYVRTVDGTSTGWVQTADLNVNLELSGLPRVTPIPTLTPTPRMPLTPTVTLTPTPRMPLTPTVTLTPTPRMPLTPTVTSTPTPPTPPLTPTLSAECEGGPLRLDAWDLGHVTTSTGWTVTIYVKGYGGDCSYTYAWDGEVKGEPTSGPMIFDVSSTIHGVVIVGTASVTSAGETVSVGLLIRPDDG